MIYIVIGVISFIIIFILSFSYYGYRKAFYNGNRIKDDLSPLKGHPYDNYDVASLINTAKDITYESIYTKSFDNIKLFGRYYCCSDNKIVHIQFNGYKGNGLRDFSGGLQLALKLKHNVILVDQRAHGFSEGKTISFGIKERYDVLSWIDYAINRFGDDINIILDGISMGAATVLMASNLNLKSNVKAIVADCPYSSPKEIIKKVLKVDLHLNPNLFYIFVYLGALIFGHFNLDQSSAVESVKNASVPILIIHGTGDEFVPISMSYKIKQANEKLITLVEVPNAPHGLSYLENYDLYYKSMLDFSNKILN